MATYINSQDFYNEYHGHKTEHLNLLLEKLRQWKPNRNYIYLVGDSSLDNKFWLRNGDEIAVNDYQYILNPALSRPDIAHQMNKLLHNSGYCTINASVEESTVASRNNGLLPQDQFVNKNITNNDILIVSVGGNDIALSPSYKTMWNMMLMIYSNSIENIEAGPDVAWGMSHFIDLFSNGVKNYILNVIGNKRPKKILICMIYFPDEMMTGGWADTTLNFLSYNDNPQKLQTAIRKMFEYATSKIKINGTEIIPVPMYEMMNGKHSNDYVDRVEPSSIGGAKLASGFVDLCFNNNHN